MFLCIPGAMSKASGEFISEVFGVSVRQARTQENLIPAGRYRRTRGI
jgi:hypothetical protein